MDKRSVLMQLQHAVNNVFTQLSGSLDQLTTEQYSFPCKNLSNATISQQLQHIIDMFQRLEKVYDSGIVNYENRQREHQIETHKLFALGRLQDVHSGLGKEDKTLILEGIYNDDSTRVM